MRKLAVLTVLSFLTVQAISLGTYLPKDNVVAAPTQAQIEAREAQAHDVSRGYWHRQREEEEKNRRTAEAEAKRIEEAKKAEEKRKAEQSDGRYTLRVQVTAYTPFEPNQTSGTGLAYDGRPAKPYHTLAVDPRVIPLGSKVYVPGLGWFLAHDTGDAIKGNIIDVCLSKSKEATQWGRRTLEVIVVPPKERYKMAW